MSQRGQILCDSTYGRYLGSHQELGWGEGGMRSYCLNRYKVSIQEDENLEQMKGWLHSPVSILNTT